MYGAVYGDLVGSLYEYREFLRHSKEDMIKASNEPTLIKEESFISDDTILTVSIADSIINHLDYEDNMRKYILDNSKHLNKDDYFEYMFSQNRLAWAKGERPGNSFGNGALSQISPVPNYINSYLLLNNEVIKVTSVSHNSKEAIRGALCVSSMIYLAKNNYSLKRIKKFVDEFYKYNYKFKLDELRSDMKFYTTCKETMEIVLYVIFNTNNFDDAIRMGLSLGGDTDTNLAIIGSIAESLYGIKDEDIKTVKQHLPENYKKILEVKKV